MWNHQLKNFLRIFILILIIPKSTPIPQQFLNSLAVLFRSRPQWPTLYPQVQKPSKFQSGASTSSSSSGSRNINVQTFHSKTPYSEQKQILIAHPIKTVSNTIVSGNQRPFPYHTHFQHNIPSVPQIQTFFTPIITTTVLPIPQKKTPVHIPDPSLMKTQQQINYNNKPTIKKFESNFTSSYPSKTLMNSPSRFQNDGYSFHDSQSLDSNSDLQWQTKSLEEISPVFPTQQTISDPFNSEEHLKYEEASHQQQFRTQPFVSSTYNNHYSRQQAKGQPALQSSKSLNFRPSPLLYTSETRESSSSHISSSESGSSVTSFRFSDAKEPRYESGFKPISYHQYASNYGTTSSHESYRNSFTQWNPSTTKVKSHIKKSHANTKNRKLQEGNALENFASFSSSSNEKENAETENFSEASIKSNEYAETIKMEEVSPKSSNVQSATSSSSELIEDWIKPSISKKEYKAKNKLQSDRKGHNQKLTGKFPVYNKNKGSKPSIRVRPAKCEKFHRYGFCPLTHHYPIKQVEKIASRCSALLSHLIAPLPNTDVRHDIFVTRNGSNKHNTNHSPSVLKKTGNGGWKWKNYTGSPLCETEEIKITPGWAKNENGDWLIIFQTEIWKQEAQISICSIDASVGSCIGRKCYKNAIGQHGTKCVQRFTAQRLAVLNPENQERCPSIRSVFLPSACVCVSQTSSTSAEQS